jgi:hypothetical protein
MVSISLLYRGGMCVFCAVCSVLTVVAYCILYRPSASYVDVVTFLFVWGASLSFSVYGSYCSRCAMSSL